MDEQDIAERETFTQADIDAAVENARREWDADISRARERSALPSDVIVKEENRLEREALTKERAELEHERLLNDAGGLLKASGLPAVFAARLCGRDANETKSNIDAFAEGWNAAVMEGVDAKLKGRAPKSGGGNGADTLNAIIIKSIRQGF